MAATKKTNIETANDALDAELSLGALDLKGDELVAYIATLDEHIELVKSIKAQYKAKLAVIASQKSRAARQERVAKALALLAAQEAQEADAA